MQNLVRKRGRGSEVSCHCEYHGAEKTLPEDANPGK